MFMLIYTSTVLYKYCLYRIYFHKYLLIINIHDKFTKNSNKIIKINNKEVNKEFSNSREMKC